MTGQPRSLKSIFPNLADDNHMIASPETDNYNCIAWAYEVNNKKMWPGYLDSYWPSECIGSDELTTIVQLYLDAGYEKCENGEIEDGYKKVAIYVNQEGPQHAALQLESGHWIANLAICKIFGTIAWGCLKEKSMEGPSFF